MTALQPWAEQTDFSSRINDAPVSKPVFHKSTDPEYNSYEEAEAAFIKLLKRSNVQTDWTWEQAMRATIKDPQFRAVKDPRDRKLAFEKYVTEVRAQEKDKEKERTAKLRAGFSAMLKSHPEIKHYTRWKTARPILQRETIFRSTDNDDERKQLFEEYIIELKKTNAEREATARKSAVDELTSILNALALEPYTRWSEALPKIQSNDRFNYDEKFQLLSKSDLLTAFENHIKALERKFNDERQQEKASKARRERKTRDAFISLLQELRRSGKIKAGTLWMEILPEFETDERYTAILGQAGSTPLDLFWDILEEEERALRSIRNDVYDVLEDRRFEIVADTPYSRFEKEMSGDDRTRRIPLDTLRLLFDRLIDKVKRRDTEDRHASERQTRRNVDMLRSRIKHLDNPPVRHDSTWESIKSRISQMEEYKTLETEDLRRSAFDKVIRRLKEKEEDLERDRETRSRRDKDRDRERDSYRGDRDRRSKRTSRSPEPDAYEADRRRAMADRERQYRKGGSTGLSPSSRDRRSLEHDRIRPSDGRLSYDRERDRDRDRRERPKDDDRHYRSRDAQSGSAVDELDYGGGSIGGSGRRRRGGDSDAESVGSRKRVKRDREKKSAEKEVEQKKEDVDMASGSEDGELLEE